MTGTIDLANGTPDRDLHGEAPGRVERANRHATRTGRPGEWLGHGLSPRRLHREAHRHPGAQVLGNLAVEHPASRVGHLDHEIDRRSDRNEDGVPPHEVRAGDPVLFEHDEALPVKV